MGNRLTAVRAWAVVWFSGKTLRQLRVCDKKDSSINEDGSASEHRQDEDAFH